MFLEHHRGRVYKWRLSDYSFDFMLIIRTRLVSMKKKSEEFLLLEQFSNDCRK